MLYVIPFKMLYRPFPSVETLLRDSICLLKPGGAKVIFLGKALEGDLITFSEVHNHHHSFCLPPYPSFLSHSNNSEISLKTEEPHACLYHIISFQANVPYYEVPSLCFAFICFPI